MTRSKALVLAAVAVSLAVALGCGARRGDTSDPQAIEHLEVGMASWYGGSFAGRRTAAGEIFDPAKMTAASRTLPLGAWVRVTHLGNGRSVVVRINDRGPYAGGRILDCSEAAARRLGFRGHGTARVAIDWAEEPGREPAAREEGRYFVRLGVFQSAERAASLRAEARARGEEVAVHRQTRFLHVHVGPFEKRKTAEKARARLVAAGFPGTIVQLEPERLRPVG
jgi:rare lipoprotein A